MNTPKILKSLSDNAAFTFEFDVSTGMVEEDIIGSSGTNYTQKAGLSSPCPLNDLIRFYFGPELQCRMLRNSKIQRLSSELLQDDYFAGKTRFEINLLYPPTNSYYRVLHFLYDDDASGHIKAFVVGRAISQVENEILSSNGEWKDMEQQRRETFYKNLMDMQSCGVFAYSMPGYQIVTVNAEALRMFRCETMEDVQRSIRELVGNIYYPMPEQLEQLKKLRTEDASVDYECVFNKGTAQECYVIAKTKVVYSPNGKRIIYSTYVDATEMHALQLNMEKAEEGVRAKAEFLLNISHDLRTPMNAIIGYTELLQANQSLDASAKRLLSKLMDSSKFLMFMLNNAIELSRLEKGLETIKESLCNVTRFSEVVDAVIENAVRDKKLHYTKDIHIHHENVMCDTMKTRVIFLNLLSNAIKYTPEGGSIHVQSEEIPSDKEGYTMFKTVITDTGIGISPEFLPQIFQEFSREKTTTESGIGGAGLGLPLVKKLLDLMGGTIDLESISGKGTKVTVIVPHRIVERQELLELTARQNPSPDKPFGHRRILLAEDNDLNAEIALMILSDAGLVCERVADGAEAVEAVAQSPEGYYDLVLMDIQMPTMDGYEATKAIRGLEGRKAQLPIVAITANALEEDKRMAYAAGMNGHVAKPIDVSALLKTILDLFHS